MQPLYLQVCGSISSVQAVRVYPHQATLLARRAYNSANINMEEIGLAQCGEQTVGVTQTVINHWFDAYGYLLAIAECMALQRAVGCNSSRYRLYINAAVNVLNPIELIAKGLI